METTEEILCWVKAEPKRTTLTIRRLGFFKEKKKANLF